ncbi:DUF349 domain-containing protein [Rufibacter quisquiliarum]|uniref:DUF349 domain-containing protein n=1 Tax=Rufibacter quisquiliarum TaxID=1549639 RepID=A0A839GPB6_9BACT|nr:DUF349 domain-containing protein [Rufibacter quisquiliarum]MBA9077375.1 hypothetical protein [Rufibacter quisquiliarum]
MMNQNPENQQNDKTEDQTAQDRAQEQRRILEERLAEINSRNQSPSAPAEPAASPVAAVEEPAPEASAPAAQPEETAAPVVQPDQTQSAVLTSEEPVTEPAAAEPTGAPVSEPAAAEEEATPVENIPLPAASEAPIEENQTEAEPVTPVAHANAPNTPVAGIPVAPAANAPAGSAPGAEHEEEEEEDLHAQEEDITSLSGEEIRKRILTLTREGQPRKAGKAVAELYKVYDQHFQLERAEALKRFVADGGEEDDFEYHAPQEHKEVEQAMQRFREARFREQRQEEEQKISNLQKKQDLLERLRAFVEGSETQTSGNAIKELQAEWKAIGPVPNAEAQQLWNSYHALLDMYYNNRSIFFELKELDRKKNLDAKTQLVERAEALANEQNINKALQELRHLHDEWKHIGPVPNDVRDQIWNRFIQASEQVHNRKKTFFEARRTEETANLEKKRALLQEIEQFQHFKNERINDWRDKTDQIQQLKERWDAAGLVPKENAEEVNKAFWSSYKAFFHNKNSFFKALDEEKMGNYRQKVALCEEAEALQESEEWDSTKEKLIQLQKKWKTIGRVPDKYSDKIWNRFRNACNTFFDRLHAEAKNQESKQNQLSSQKQEFLEQLATQVADPTFVGHLDGFNQVRQDWDSLGSDGKRNGKQEDRFQQLLAKYLDKVPELTPEQKEQTLFKLQLQQLKSSPDADHKLYQKEQHLRRDIIMLENDISTLKTNIEFFARSKNAEKLREEYQSKIDDANERIQQLKRQLKALRAQ